MLVGASNFTSYLITRNKFTFTAAAPLIQVGIEDAKMDRMTPASTPTFAVGNFAETSFATSVGALPVIGLTCISATSPYARIFRYY